MMISKYFKLLKGFIFNLKCGIKYGYPFCCILRFCWDCFLGRMSGNYRIQKHNTALQWDPGSGGWWQVDFVPCLIFHEFTDANLRWHKFQ